MPGGWPPGGTPRASGEILVRSSASGTAGKAAAAAAAASPRARSSSTSSSDRWSRSSAANWTRVRIPPWSIVGRAPRRSCRVRARAWRPWGGGTGGDPAAPQIQKTIRKTSPSSSAPAVSPPPPRSPCHPKASGKNPEGSCSTTSAAPSSPPPHAPVSPPPPGRRTPTSTRPSTTRVARPARRRAGSDGQSPRGSCAIVQPTTRGAQGRCRRWTGWSGSW